MVRVYRARMIFCGNLLLKKRVFKGSSWKRSWGSSLFFCKGGVSHEFLFGEGSFFSWGHHWGINMIITLVKMYEMSNLCIAFFYFVNPVLIYLYSLII